MGCSASSAKEPQKRACLCLHWGVLQQHECFASGVFLKLQERPPPLLPHLHYPPSACTLISMQTASCSGRLQPAAAPAVHHNPPFASLKRVVAKKATSRTSRHILPISVMMAADAPPLVRPDSSGRYGRFGGKYVPETLISALEELEVAYKDAMSDPTFIVSCRRRCCGLSAIATCTSP
jgi:hypothetical protein